MKKFDLTCEVSVGFTDTGDISVYLWLGNDYGGDPIEFTFKVQELIEETMNDYRSFSGKIHSDDQTYLKLMASALENNVNIAVDTIRMELQGQ